ncbi:MAG: diguanylate cyclase [Gammaproteobacteria bacterium]|nr:diguanylate cyclase [Gammaproteobacteria bacterium]
MTVVLTAILGGVAALFYFSEVENTKTLREFSESINVASGKEAIEHSLKNIVSDLMILSQHDSLVQIGGEHYPAIDALSSYMLIMMREKQVYDQLRFLDETGMEVVRVNYDREQPYIVASEKLQNKDTRYYFKETLGLSKGEVFVSPFDLNVENGKIEIPFKPMIRLGTPVFDNNGNKRGVVLINYFGEDLIQGLLMASSSIADHITLLNYDSYWLHNPDPGLEWGFMLGHEKKFKSFFPKPWERIANTDSGQFLRSSGLFTYDTLYPLASGVQTGSSYVSNTGGSNYYWKLVSHVKSSTIDIANANVTTKLLGIVAPLFMLMVLASFWLAYAHTKHKQAEEALQKLYEALELRVEERTIELSKVNEALTTDVTKSKQEEEKFRFMATHDALTGLYNRGALEQRLSNEIKRAARYQHSLSMFMLDIDHFKFFNDTYGHMTGDIVLRKFGRLLESSVRSTDYVARYGGEEFIVILPGTDAVKAEELGERLRQQTEDYQFQSDDNTELKLTVSIGIASFPLHAQTAQDLLKASDSALYTAKEAGRNQVKTF